MFVSWQHSKVDYFSHQVVNFGQEMLIVEKICSLLSIILICSFWSQDNRSRRNVTIVYKLCEEMKVSSCFAVHHLVAEFKYKKATDNPGWASLCNHISSLMCACPTLTEIMEHPLPLRITWSHDKALPFVDRLGRAKTTGNDHHRLVYTKVESGRNWCRKDLFWNLNVFLT